MRLERNKMSYKVRMRYFLRDNPLFLLFCNKTPSGGQLAKLKDNLLRVIKRNAVQHTHKGGLTLHSFFVDFK